MKPHPIQVIPSGAIAADAGIGFSMVLKRDGSLWGTGRNFRGQLGDGTKTRKESFVFAQKIASAMTVITGGYHSIVLTQKGEVTITITTTISIAITTTITITTICMAITTIIITTTNTKR